MACRLSDYFDAMNDRVLLFRIMHKLVNRVITCITGRQSRRNKHVLKERPSVTRRQATPPNLG